MKALLLLLLLFPAIGYSDNDARVVLVTSEGDITLSFFAATAPASTAQFLKLVQLGVYDHTPFTFVEPGYYVQLGTAAERSYSLTLAQKEAIHELAPEFSNLEHHKGVVTFSLSNDDPTTAQTAITFMMGDAPHMDGKSTIFATVERGMEVLDRIEQRPRDGDGRVIKRPEIVRALVAGSPEAVAAASASAVRLEETQIRFAIEALAAIVLITLASFALRQRFPARVLGALNLMITFVAAFTLFLLVTPLTRETPLLGGVMFMGLVGFYKLMNRFEAG